MSTRCNIIIGSDDWKLYIYRHSDGYPSSIIPDLREFIEWVRKQTSNTVRFGSPSQFAGWLIVWGYIEHNKWKKELKKTYPDSTMMDFKVGSYEPTDSLHGDIEWVYKIDDTGTIFYSEAPSGLWDADEVGISPTKEDIERNIKWKSHTEWVESEEEY